MTCRGARQRRGRPSAPGVIGEDLGLISRGDRDCRPWWQSGPSQATADRESSFQ